MSSTLTLRDWFLYSDREKLDFNPTIGTTITIERLWEGEKSDLNSPDWRREECLIRSALVPVDQLHAAAAEIPSPHYLSFEMGWGSQDQFSFGDYARYKAIQLYPLALMIRHPITEEDTIELNYKFLIYHALIKKNSAKYYHPLDNIQVAETYIDFHKFHNPTARVTIHRDYLRDFLATVKMGLLISVAADRFANAPTEEGLELNPVEDLKIDEFSTISSYVHDPKFTNRGYFAGRSILHRSFIIQPYDMPRFERSPWYYYGEKRIGESELPVFIVNNEGKRQALPQNGFIGNYIEQGIGNFGYLYFRPEVLQKYLQVPGYGVFFHMRNWGIASLPGDRGTIDVGINSRGLVNAFAPDIAKLNFAEQAYWASFSSLPSSEICEELFQTRMQLNPPNSPGVIDLIRGSRTLLDHGFRERYHLDLFSHLEPSKPELSRLSVGPLTNQYSELLELARILYGWVIETMKIDSLRGCLSTLGQSADNNLRQIKLLEKILIAKGLKETDARSVTAPLVGLNELRIGSAHIGILELEPSFQLMGALSAPQTPRAGWNLCVDSVIRSLSAIANSIEA